MNEFFNILAKGVTTDVGADKLPNIMRPGNLQARVQKVFHEAIEEDNQGRIGYLTPMEWELTKLSWENGELSELVDMMPDIVSGVALAIVEKRRVQRAKSAREMQEKLARASFYLPVATARFGPTQDASKLRWSYDPHLEPTGLLGHYLAERDQLPAGVPVHVRLLNENEQVVDDNGAERRVKMGIPREEWGFVRELGFLPTKGKLAWWWDGEIREKLLQAFPDDVSLNSYCQRLAAALIPYGYIPRGRVAFSKARLKEDGSPLFCWQEGYDQAVPDGADGSHWYNLNSNRLEVAEGYSIQISALGEAGEFSKGIAEGIEIDGNIDFVLDPGQVKGAWKGKIEEGTILEMDIGILRKFKGGSYPLNFEVFQFTKPSLHADGSRAYVEDAMGLVEDTFDKMLKGGTLGMLKGLTQDSEELALVYQLLLKLKEQGNDINPMSVPLARARIADYLRRTLWGVAQGAGFYGKQLEIKMDSRVKEGTIITAGFKPGSEVALWRYPTVLPSGLKTMMVVKKGGRMLPPGRVYMNPVDVFAIQGDDDGDVVGATTDERVIRIFKSAMDSRRFSIEPVGKKFARDVESPEGLLYMEQDPRGPVGITTLWQAAILSASSKPEAFWYALSMAVLNQYAIDSAKKVVTWPNPWDLADPNRWTEQSDGSWKCDARPLFAENEEFREFPMEEYSKFMAKVKLKLGINRLVDNGYGRKKLVKTQPLAWRVQQDTNGDNLSKAIDYRAWVPCKKKDGGYGTGNVVHSLHDKSLRLFKKMVGASSGDLEEVKDDPRIFRDLLMTALTSTGFKWQTRHKNWSEYEKTSRRFAQIESLGNQWRKAMQSGLDGDDMSNQRDLIISRIYQEFQTNLVTLGIDEMLEVWWWENTPHWHSSEGNGPRVTQDPALGETEEYWPLNKPNWAFRAITFAASPVLEKLGVVHEALDDWAKLVFIPKSSGSMPFVAKFSEDVLRQQSPWEYLTKKIQTNTHHGKMVKDENGDPIELHECSKCQKLLTGYVMRQWRKSKTVKELQFMRTFISSLNHDFGAPHRDLSEGRLVEYDQFGDYDEYMPAE